MRKKVELPLTTDTEVESLVSHFEALTLPYEHWTHRAHLAVAVVYLHKYPFEKALARTRERIQSYNQARGDAHGYHETITVSFLMKIREEHAAGRAEDSLHGEIERLSSICTMDWLHTHFSAERLGTPEAKAGWVEPDLKRFD